MLNSYIHTTVITILAICPGYLHGQQNMQARQYDRQNSTYVNNRFMSVTVDSVMKCCAICGIYDTCRSLSFHEDNDECQLNDQHQYDVFVQISGVTGCTSFFPNLEPECQDNWTLILNRCYMFVDLSLTWSTSQTHCQSLGGHLAVPYSVSNFLLYDNIPTCEPGQCFPWIGVSDIASEGSVVAVNGYTVPQEVLDIVNSNTEIEDCGFVAPGNQKVYMYPCGDEGSFICEKAPEWRGL